jgi:hypothetical protein
MTQADRNPTRLSGNLTRNLRLAAVLTALSVSSLALPAFAGPSEANAAIGRADAKIEMMTRQAGQAGDTGDQTFNMARQRVTDARAALKDNHYDRAEMLADEASLLATLTGEKATLAALQTSHDNLVSAAAK